MDSGYNGIKMKEIVKALDKQGVPLSDSTPPPCPSPQADASGSLPHILPQETPQPIYSLFECPHCNQNLEVPGDLLGQTIECPTCKGHITLPKPAIQVQAPNSQNQYPQSVAKEQQRSFTAQLAPPSSFWRGLGFHVTVNAVAFGIGLLPLYHFAAQNADLLGVNNERNNLNTLVSAAIWIVLVISIYPFVRKMAKKWHRVLSIYAGLIASFAIAFFFISLIADKIGFVESLKVAFTCALFSHVLYFWCFALVIPANLTFETQILPSAIHPTPLPTTFTTNPKPDTRFWARLFDLTLFGIVFVRFVAILAPGLLEYGDIVLQVVACIFWVFIEAFLLFNCGYTPGKWLFRVIVRNTDGSGLAFGQALSRAFNVWIRGLAFGIPLVAMITALVARNRLLKQGKTTWDDQGHFVVHHGKVGAVRVIIAVIWFLVWGFLTAS